MQDHDETVTAERTPGRRPLDSAHLVRWVPFLSLFFFMIMQTIYMTRYVSGLEASNATLVATVAEIKAEVKTLSSSATQGAVPNAQSQWRLDIMERQVTELRSASNDNARRLTAIELQPGRERRER